ncbi:hypothetical protein CIG75_03235 [Tumebacillus algifaecis]|uniref:TVP38/TMEM64 family membrane protein n=1 Tax=Tumebacillus algifaecis TaxID=1214604 RepID=A0A223CY23_9BACL|nr:TVP38/TMEM64 family protein [Tumebacillus algifaecis]ASS74096.1 hypothetical protein CIG75_03235 [Tumebacillus algifaecis]
MEMGDLQIILDQYRAFGPLPGIVLALLETFFPVLPLIPIVMANAMAFGLWEGFFYSWIGVGLGQSLLFLLVRLLGHRLRDRMMKKYPDSRRFLRWVEQKGFTSIFILCAFPFSPSTTVAVVGGLTTISIRTFILATFASKGVMVFILSYIGHDLPTWLEHPWKFVVVAIVMVGLWYGGKWVEKRGDRQTLEKAA